jgi:hypothetical protein
MPKHDDRNEPTDPGLGKRQGPSREATVLGVGLAPPGEAPAAPVVVLAPTPREKTVLGVGLEGADRGRPPLEAAAPRVVAAERSASGDGVWDLSRPKNPAPAPAPEPSIAVDLSEFSAREPARIQPARMQPAAAPRYESSEISLSAAGLPRRRRWGWLLVLALIALAGGVGYTERGRWRPAFDAQWKRWVHLRG